MVRYGDLAEVVSTSRGLRKKVLEPRIVLSNGQPYRGNFTLPPPHVEDHVRAAKNVEALVHQVRSC